MKIEKRFGKNFIGVKLYKCFRFKYYGEGEISMVDELAITNEIWRKWDEAKIIPPMTWAELRKKVEEYAKAGVVALDDFITLLEQKVTVVRAPPGSKKEWILRHPSEGAVSKEELRRRQQETIERLRSMGPRQLPWSNSEPEAIVEERELPTFAEWLLATVKRVWETKKGETYWEWLIEPTERGVLVGLRGAGRPHELFPTDVIEKIKPYHVFPRFRFETGRELETAETILERQGISTGRIDMALMIFGDADYALEVLAERGVDTSRILVERG
jgi:hypothetical protein